ncbi:Coiled-coil domain-containing protein 12 [Holothuria leucospilota]|uniref:Coiled-coil domain-containing protein 12 n=1 Tax=Holothuria leucospilota TaxID=206669 RepID=A0A9Q1C1P1_HOLLE|nr:Coiled-coil domain-containing protein 12 [Holothuria leucospilota]
MESVGSLEEAARKRKERLQALKRKKVSDEEKHADDSEEPLTKIPVSDSSLESGQTETAKKEVAFKNYKPEDDTLQEKVQPPAKLAEVEDHIQDQLEAAKPEPVVEEIDLNNLAPRKPDW